MEQRLQQMMSYKSHLDNVVGYFENSGRQAMEAGQVDLGNLETKVWDYVVDALNTIADNITASANLIEEGIEKELDTADALITQVEMIKSQIELGKEYFMYQRMQGITETPVVVLNARKIKNDKITNARINKNHNHLDDNSSIDENDEVGLQVVQSSDLLTEEDLRDLQSMPSSIRERTLQYSNLGSKL